MNNAFAKVLISYVDTLGSAAPHDVIARYIAPYHIHRGNFMLSKPMYRKASPIISQDEMAWLQRELEKRQLDNRLYDWTLVQDERMPCGRIEFHYKPFMTAAHYFLQFNCNMTLAELDEMYNQLQEEHKTVHVVDPFSAYVHTAKSSTLHDYKVVCDEKQNDVIASASEEPSVLQIALDQHNSGEEG